MQQQEDTSKINKSCHVYESSGLHELIGYQPPNNGLSYWSDCAQFCKTRLGLMSCAATAFAVQNEPEVASLPHLPRFEADH